MKKIDCYNNCCSLRVGRTDYYLCLANVQDRNDCKRLKVYDGLDKHFCNHPNRHQFRRFYHPGEDSMVLEMELLSHLK